MPSRAEISDAAHRLAPRIRRTPVITLTDSALAAAPVTLKLEFLQHTGSFKARGAFNRLLTAGHHTGPVVAASGGNHGAAVAYAAQALGRAATIFVPQATPPAKLARIAGYGATIVQGGANYAEAHAASVLWGAERAALEVHAYDDPAVLAGQGTIGAELEHDAPDLTHVLVAVGGGGLIGGIAGWYEGQGTQVVAVEPTACATLHAACRAGHPVPVTVGGVAADSLGARQVGAATLEVAQRTGMATVLVTDDAIRQAQTWLWEQLRIIAEPGGATALAALLGGTYQPAAGARLGVILCGANTAPGSIPAP